MGVGGAVGICEGEFPFGEVFVGRAGLGGVEVAGEDDGDAFGDIVEAGADEFCGMGAGIGGCVA